MRSIRLGTAVALVAIVGATAACGGVSANMGTSKPPAATPAAASPPPAVPGGKGGSPAPSTVASLPGAWVTVSSLHASDGSLITMAAFHGLVQFALHDGSKSPGPLPGHVM